MWNDQHLARRPVNFRPLTPLDMLARAVDVSADKVAVVWHGDRWTHRQFQGIVHRLANELVARGIGKGDVVSILSSNRPEMLAAHFAVPMVGGILCTINTRLDSSAVSYILQNSRTRLLLTDSRSFSLAVVAASSTDGEATPLVSFDENSGGIDRVELLKEGTGAMPPDVRSCVYDEWQPLALNYTSGTTGRPKGVVYHHRGAYLSTLGNIFAFDLRRDSVYLWTVPMFHSNGWTHPWGVTGVGGRHVCLDSPDPGRIFELIEQEGVTHMACAPIVLQMLAEHPKRIIRNTTKRVRVATGGAAPTVAMLDRIELLGFDLVHLYGLTECHGPTTSNAPSIDQEEILRPDRELFLSRQGHALLTAAPVRVVDSRGLDVPADGISLGEIVMTGNTVMAGYLGDPRATEEVFAGGVFHSGDVGVMHADHSIEIKDRLKDIIISGGENISTIELERVVNSHPAVLFCAVVAAPHPRWGETPVAYVELKDGAYVSAEELSAHCRSHLASFKVPRHFVMKSLPRTPTGKIQKYVLRDEAKNLYSDVASLAG